ncbi:hypothetical protein L0668_10585 [Paraglaciecola aquimarina]|uniref:Dienelactone hydrolase domain-containing protein n=1 Tax=Paraglaciecola algarum TaxID=3050085 RepID=A0ABS9D6L5_9ALTE|nr:hypothetical protein [Paraglaciecola sp. G1-23]MCF2948554.1 hypothetical protein [Paraglaciecola sp. G1-23]
MSLILVSDVFGSTPALLKLKEQLNADLIIDPYLGQSMGFKDESAAYTHFMEEVGLEEYVSNLIKILDSIKEQTTLIGFSVGATAIWKLSQDSEHNIKQALCYYGSQIRNFTTIPPSFTTHLVFPKSEPHFDVCKLNQQLSNKENVTTTQVDYLHGFMNFHSKNFNKTGYEEQLEFLLKAL